MRWGGQPGYLRALHTQAGNGLPKRPSQHDPEAQRYCGSKQSLDIHGARQNRVEEPVHSRLEHKPFENLVKANRCCRQLTAGSSLLFRLHEQQGRGRKMAAQPTAHCTYSTVIGNGGGRQTSDIDTRTGTESCRSPSQD